MKLFSKVLLAPVSFLCMVLTASGQQVVSSEDSPLTQNFAGVSLSVSVRDVTMSGVTFYGDADFAENSTADSFGIVFSKDKEFDVYDDEAVPIVHVYGTKYSVSVIYLEPGTTYYYASYIQGKGIYRYSEIRSFETELPCVYLSKSGSANCYIVSEAGSYAFKAVAGNSNLLVSNIASTEVLWESFGTSEKPSIGDLIKNVSYKDGLITFETPASFKEGNAVIAAKDAFGNILWSWHIWLTDQPEEQEYYNNAGIMMDRNLGATSATPGDVGALGLLYQWGRKDPFLGSSSISNSEEAKSTIAWPSAVESDSYRGTIEYATAHPTTFITGNDINLDWHYTGSSITDDTRWTTSESDKSIYDPCPPGWRLPDGGENDVWSKAIGSSYLEDDSLYCDDNKGMNFSERLGSYQMIWYPAAGCRDNVTGGLMSGGYGEYWSASPDDSDAFSMSFSAYDCFFSDSDCLIDRPTGRSVRCIQE